MNIKYFLIDLSDQDLQITIFRKLWMLETFIVIKNT